MSRTSFRKLSPWIVVAVLIAALVLFLYPRQPLPYKETPETTEDTEENPPTEQDAAIEKLHRLEPAVLIREAAASQPERPASESSVRHAPFPAPTRPDTREDDARRRTQQAILSALQEAGHMQNGEGLARKAAAGAANSVIASGLSAANKSNIAPLAHLELEIFPADETGWGMAATTLVPFYESAEKTHTAFTQLSFRADREEFVSTEGEKSLIPEKVASAGLVYRNFRENRSFLWGLNTFADSDLDRHWRASLGVDIDWGYFVVSSNYYHPLSGWQNSAAGFESRVRGGFDLEARGRIKELDGTELGLRGFTWSGYNGQKNINGVEVSARYRPISLVGFDGAYSFHDGDLPLWQVGVSLLYQIGIPLNTQTRRLSYAEKVDLQQLRHSKVRRENRLIMQERTDGAQTVTVAFLKGTLNITNDRGTFSAQPGDRFAYPVTVFLSANAGDVVGLSFSDGANLSAGTGSVFAISRTGIAQLGAGFLRYRSGAVKRSLSTDAASIRLIGTEVELRNDGGQHTVGILSGKAVINGAGYSARGDKFDIVDALTGKKLSCEARAPHIKASADMIDGPSLRVSAWGVFDIASSCPPQNLPEFPQPEVPGHETDPEDPGDHEQDHDHEHDDHHDHDDHHGRCGCGHHDRHGRRHHGHGHRGHR